MLFLLFHFLILGEYFIKFSQSKYLIVFIRIIYECFFINSTGKTNLLLINTNNIKFYLILHRWMLINFVLNHIKPIRPSLLFNLKHNRYIFFRIFSIFMKWYELLFLIASLQLEKFNYFIYSFVFIIFKLLIFFIIIL